MKKRALAGAAIAAALLLTGCSGGSSGSGDAGGDVDSDAGAAALEQTSVTLGLVPVADFVTAYIAQDEGYFADEGLEVKMEVMQNAAAIVPGVMNGQVHFGTAAISPLISASEQGLPVVIVANAADVPLAVEDDPTAILVKPDSGIASPKDLEGKVVAVNALQAAVELVVSQSVENDGGDPSEVTYVAMPFPDMAAALERGDIDAAGVIEPFRSSGLAAGFVSIASPFHEVLVPGKSHAVYFSSKQFIAEAPNTVAAFDRALRRASETANENPELVREMLQKYGNLPAEVTERINLPGYSPEPSSEAIERYISVMEAQGFIAPGAVTPADILPQ